MIEALKRSAVRHVKPRVSPAAWTRLTGHAPVAEQEAAARRTLTDIASRTGTDKWGTHFYTPHYERHLAHLRDETFTLLEFGVGGYRQAMNKAAQDVIVGGVDPMTALEDAERRFNRQNNR